MPVVTANGVSLYYQSSGTGEPILWIQGLGADHSAWLGQVYAFRNSFRCIAFDNRDVGRSQIVDAPYSVVDMAEDAAELIAALGLQGVHVVGLSLGGSIAQELAIRHSSLVRSLTLVSATARPDERLGQMLDAWASIYGKVGPLDFYRQGMVWMFSYRFFERPRSTAAMLHYVANHPQPPEAFARQAAAGLHHDTTARLGLIDVPTLVVSGEEDILVPLRLSRVLVEGIPGAKLAVIPAAAHAVNVEQTAAFNDVVTDFLSGIVGDSSSGYRTL